MKPFIQALAKCGDQSFPEEGCKGVPVLEIAYNLLPQQLVQRQGGSTGNCLLHIVAQAIIDSAKNGDKIGTGKESRLDCERKFMKSYCTHWESSDDYLLNCCECTPLETTDPQISNFYLGCNCQNRGSAADTGSESNDEDCSLCKKEYVRRRRKLFPRCRCLEEYKKIQKIQKRRGKSECYCERAFECYASIMNDPRRADKKFVLERMLKACPMASCLLNTMGQLPIHMAVGEGKKQFYEGVQSLNSLLLRLNSANLVCSAQE